MRGRGSARVLMLRLLVVVFVVVIPISVRGQAGVESRDFAKKVPPSRTLAQPSLERIFLPTTLPRLRPVPPGTTGFPLIARTAGIIFSGSVTSIARAPAVGSQAAQTIAITFHVEQGIRGTASGQDLTIFQWIGLWASGQRYRVGEHVLLFLYSPSKLGLTSSVGGTMGRFAVDPLGNVTLTEEHRAALSADPLLGGRSRVLVRDFDFAVRRARGDE